jgi:hypothetical protein
MAGNSDGTNILKKIVQFFKTRSKAPPPALGDGKYASEETPDSLKGGIIKELKASKKGIPEDIDIVLEFVKLAAAGGYKFDPAQVPAAVLTPSLPSGLLAANVYE